MSANRMFGVKVKLSTKENNVNQNKTICSLRRHAGIELILHGRAKHEKRLERCVMVSLKLETKRSRSRVVIRAVEKTKPI